MKKTIFLFFAAILCAMSISAAGTTPNRLYMKRDWQTDNAWFAAYFFGNGEKWVKMTDLGNGLYTCETPQDKSYPNVIFCRMDGSKQNNLSWGAKWEQTADLTLSASKDFYKKTSWTTFAPTVAGDEVLLGENWNPGNTANKMTKQNNGTYTLVKEGITLEKKAYEYKVTDGSWDWSVGKNGNNASLSINPAGTYNVTFTYTPSSNTVSASATPIYTITASANPATAGTVTGTGKYAKDTPVTLEATPNAGYKFVNWTVGGAEKSTDATYSFTASADVTAVANFELSDPEVPTYTISVSANDDAMGTVTGAGDYTEDSPVTLTATPNAGYRFVNWTVGSEVKSTETTYSFTASETLTIVANFEAIPKYDITVKAVVPETWTNATIGIHYWGDGISGTSTPVATEKEGNWNKYTIKDVLEGQSVNVIFLNGTSWTDDKSKQTANITGITEDKCFQISAKTLDGEGKCTFTEVDCAADIKPEGDVYTVVGSSDELGLAWDPTKKANDMEKQDNGSYKKVYSNVELTTSVEWKIAKNGDWWNETPLENKAANGNSVLTISKSGIYNVTFTLSKDLKTAHAEAELLEETNTVADCFVSGNAALTGGAGWAGNEFKMEYDDATETYSYTLTELATDKAYELKIVLGGAWHSYADLASVPTGVTKGNDDAIAFKMAAAGDVTVTYNVENGIGLVGTFAAPETKYYIAGTQNLTGFDWKENGLEMTKEGDVYKHTFSEVNAGIYEFKITDGTWTKTWGFSNLAKNYVGVSQGKDGEGNDNGNIKIVTEEAKNITVIFDLANNNITLEGWEEEVPTVITYVLMGVNGDWTTGIELTQNPDNANEYMLLNQTITRATDAIKVVTLTNGTATAWCGDVDEYSDAIYENNWDKDGNIELEDGIYNFYFKVSDKKIYIDQTTLLRTGTNKYGTIYIPYTPESVSGATFYQVAGKGTEDGQEGVYLESVDVVEAGKPYIYERTGNQVVKIVFSGEKATNGGAVNGLIGTDTKSTHVPVNNYILINNTFCKTDGSSKVRGYRAYLDLNAVTGDKPQPMPGRRYIGMSVQGENAATGLDNITNGENTTIKFIENGQLIIIRNGEKFNAQGQKF